MRCRPFAVAAAVALLMGVAGCGDKQAPVASRRPVAEMAPPPAASAGGACILWDYGLIKRTLGVTFTAAASQSVGATSVCVVQTEGGDAPYLVLSVVESTKADTAVFLDAMPERARRVKGLGKAAYRLVGKPSGGYGPRVEIGWLSSAKQVQTLAFTFPEGAAQEQVDRMSTRLVALAEALDTTKG